MIVEEALNNLTPAELEIHTKLQDVNEDLLLEYILKRTFYKEPTKEEIDAINDIYENGETEFTVTINNKPNKFKLLSQAEKNSINSFIDAEFNGSSALRKFQTEDMRKLAMSDLTIVATVAVASISMSDSVIESDAGKLIAQYGKVAGKTYFVEALPMPLIKTLYDRYMDFERRIFDIMQYDSVRKKSVPPSVIG